MIKLSQDFHGPTIHLVGVDVQDANCLLRIASHERGLLEKHSSGSEFLKSYDPSRVGCLILDADHLKTEFVEILCELRKRLSLTPSIVLFSAEDNDASAEAIQHGAYRVISKPLRLQAFRNVVQEAIKLDSEIRPARSLLIEIGSLFDRLTRRERQIVSFVVSGKCSREIAGLLGISVRTIEAHRTHILAKLHAKSVNDIVRMTMILEFNRTCAKWPFQGLCETVLQFRDANRP